MVNVLFMGGILGGSSAALIADPIRLMELSQQFAAKADRQKEEVMLYAKKHGIPIRQVFPNGRVVELMRIENGIPVFYTTQDTNQTVTTHTDTLWKKPFEVNGSDYNTSRGRARLGIWDGGGVRTTHREFGGRVTQKDNPSSDSNHSTHVAGIMIAAGVDPGAKGMAPAAKLKAYDWKKDTAEMSDAAAAGMEISNHSYGRLCGWNWKRDHGRKIWSWYGDTSVDRQESYWFGFYDDESADFDKIAYEAPDYLIVKAAGNDRNDDAPRRGTPHSHNGGTMVFRDTHNDDGFDQGGYDTLGPKAVAKNVLTVGAVRRAPRKRNSRQIVMSGFSGWGPADDGRIKPDIVADGVNVYAPFATRDNGYGVMSGTSMATPNVSGTLALLQEYYRKTHDGEPMRGAALKALVIQTADEAGSAPGPDYRFGWGLLDARHAADLIKKDRLNNLIESSTLQEEGDYVRYIAVREKKPKMFKATLAWMDPPGTPVAPQLDPPDKMLVNDLDLKIIRLKDGKEYYPWTLDGTNYTLPATRDSRNDTDNVEQVQIDTLQRGIYKVIVSHSGTFGGEKNYQDFSLIVDHPDYYPVNDFDGDGYSDILWNIGSGKYLIWKMRVSGKKRGVKGKSSLGQHKGWRIAGIGDIDHDGRSDLVWDRGKGRYVVWFLDVNNPRAEVKTRWYVEVDEAWTLSAVADFDGDGSADFLWKTGDKEYTIWKFDSLGVHKASLPLTVAKGWSVVGTGHFDADAASDILWKKPNGGYVIWKMGPASHAKNIWKGKKKGWQVVGIGDFDGNGLSDMLWKRGDLYAITKTSPTGKFQGLINLGHHKTDKVSCIGDYDGDGHSDILWKRGKNLFWIQKIGSSKVKGRTLLGKKRWTPVCRKEVSNAGQSDWLYEIGGVNQDKGRSVTVDDQGNVYVVGYVLDTSLFDTPSLGSYDGFVVKYNAKGERLWSRLIGGSGEDFINDVQWYDSRLYLVGNSSSKVFEGKEGSSSDYYHDPYVCVLSAEDGSTEDVHFLHSGLGDSGNSIAVGKDLIFFIGYTHSYGETFGYENSHSRHGYIASLKRSDLSVNYVKFFGPNSAGNMDPGDIVLQNGKVYFSGAYQTQFCIDDSGEEKVLNAPVGTGKNTFLVSMNSSGTDIEIGTYAVTKDDDYSTGLAIDDSSIYLTGYTYHYSAGGEASDKSKHFFVTRIDPSTLESEWIKWFGDGSGHYSLDITTTSDGEIAITGNALGELNGETYHGKSCCKYEGDIFIMLLDRKGTVLDTKLIGDKGSEKGTGIASDDSGNLFFTGYGDSDIKFGGEIAKHHGSGYYYDAIIGKTKLNKK